MPGFYFDEVMGLQYKGDEKTNDFNRKLESILRNKYCASRENCERTDENLKNYQEVGLRYDVMILKIPFVVLLVKHILEGKEVKYYN